MTPPISRDQQAAISKLAQAFQDFGAVGSENDVLDALIWHGESIAPRVLLVVRRGDRWAQFLHGKVDEENLLPEEGETVYQRAAERKAVVAGECSDYPAHRPLYERLGNDGVYCAAVPLLFGDSVPAVLYADAPERERLDVSSLEILCQGAWLAIRALRLSQQKEKLVAEPVPQVVTAPERAPPGKAPAMPPTESLDAVPIDFGRGMEEEFDLWVQSMRRDVEAAASGGLLEDPFFPQETRVAPSPSGPADLSPAPPAAPKEASQFSEEEQRQHADALRFTQLLIPEEMTASRQWTNEEIEAMVADFKGGLGSTCPICRSPVEIRDQDEANSDPKRNYILRCRKCCLHTFHRC